MAAKKMLVSLNMNGNEIQNFLVHVLASAPAAVEGKMYYNSVDHTLYYYDGTTWVDISSVSNAFGAVKIGSSVIEADSGSDTIEFVAGDNITLIADTTNDKITISVTPALGDAAELDVDDSTSSISSSSTDTKVPTSKLVYNFVSEAIAASDAMIFKGTIGASADDPTITALPTTYKVGWTYRVITDGTYAGKVCEVGDLIIALVNRAGSGNLDSDWCVAQTNIDGAITSITAGDGITVTGTGNSRTITAKLQKAEVTLAAGSTTTTASVTDLVSYKAFDASTGEEVVINCTQGSSSVTFSIAAAYTNAIKVKYLYYVAS